MRYPKKIKEDKPKFVASGIRQQGFFVPLVFPSLNDYTRAATQTYGHKGHRGTGAADIKRRMETTIRMQIRLAKLLPMESVFFLLTYFEVGRSRNKDNISATAKKFLFDALQGQGILRNDGWKEVFLWFERFMTTPGTPGVHVEMYCPFQAEQQILEIVNKNTEATFHDWKRLMKEVSR